MVLQGQVLGAEEGAGARALGFTWPAPPGSQPRGATPLTPRPREFCSTHRDRGDACACKPWGCLRQLLGGEGPGWGQTGERDPAPDTSVSQRRPMVAGSFCDHPAGHACIRSARSAGGLVATGGRLTPPGTPRQSHSCCPSFLQTCSAVFRQDVPWEPAGPRGISL